MISCARARLHHDHRHPRLAQHHRGVALVGAAAALEDDRALTHMISDLLPRSPSSRPCFCWFICSVDDVDPLIFANVLAQRSRWGIEIIDGFSMIPINCRTNER